ncbi:MAG TPA: phytanoyl-CoA dioxygenase family protein [Bryobacteraceae bacterium]|nr:phytanoyl-CoA dioxygenase family protein [Bryobacteraceae bacterium]
MTAAKLLPGVPDVESPLFEKIFAEKNVSPETLEIARTLRRDGFVVLDFPDPDFNQIAEKIIKTLDRQYDWEGWRKGTAPNLRVQDAWDKVPEVKRIACNPTILRLLSDLYGRRAFPFQTLNFPVGTQQHFHTDSVHFSSCPERFMAGVWVALEDIDSENGPLIYYPGSHALPVFTNEHIGINPDTQASDPYGHYGIYIKTWEALVDALQLKPLQFHAKKGQALIWAANLLHGGAAQTDLKRTRYSQVTHYYFDNCSYYTPMSSVPFLGPILFRNIVDISTGKPAPNMINTVPVAKSQLEHATPRNYSIRPKLPPDFDAAAYLKANPDVAAAKADPAAHWINFGYHEGRPMR